MSAIAPQPPALPYRPGVLKPRFFQLGGPVVALLAVVGGLFLPSILGGSFYLGVATQGLILGIGALAIAFLLYQCGLCIFGIAGFSGGATYLVAIAANTLGWGIYGSIGAAVGGVLVFSLVFGSLIVRTGHIQFAMLTLAFGQMLKQAVQITSFRPITAGDDGITINFQGTFLGLTQADLADPVRFWPVAWLAMCLVVAIVWFVSKSRFGTVLRAIHDNEERMRFSGFNTYLPRLLAFLLSGFIASVSGVLMALHVAYASPEILDFSTGGHVLTAAMIGGISGALSPVLGGLFFALGQDFFGASGHLDLLTGIAVVVIVVFFPNKSSESAASANGIKRW